jgi:hypothetical protein
VVQETRTKEQAVKIRAAQATTTVLFALVMGVFWGTWFSLSRTMDQLSAETFLAVGHEMIRNLGGPMAVLLPLSLLSALVTLALLWPHRSDGALVDVAEVVARQRGPGASRDAIAEVADRDGLEGAQRC